MKLYEINAEIERTLAVAFENAEENEGEIGEEIYKTLDELEIALDEKVSNIIRVIKNRKAEAEALKTESAKLSARARTADRAVDFLKEYLTTNLKHDYKFSDQYGALSFRRSESLVCTVSALDLPKRFRRYRDPEVDKVEIKKEIKAGKSFNGVYIQENWSAQIK